MQLDGSCHCGKVRFSLNTKHPYPFNVCYCGICLKTAGGGGYAINLGGDADSLKVEGEEFITCYQAMVENDNGETIQSPLERRFCNQCGSALWAWDPRWPELIHPFASAIDTELPTAPEHTHLMLDSKREWVPVHSKQCDRHYAEYPQESIEDWHKRLGLEC